MKRETEKVEGQALEILKTTHMFDDVVLTLKDRPDIQAEDKSWGIEVVRAIDRDVTQIQKVFRNKNRIPHSVDGIEVSGSQSTTRTKSYNASGELVIEVECSIRRMNIMAYGKSEENTTLQCITRKLEKLQNGNYDGFSKIGLFVFTMIQKSAKEDFVRILQGYEGPMFDIIFFSDIPHMDAGFHKVDISLWTITKEELE